jgi:hypothetical protein
MDRIILPSLAILIIVLASGCIKESSGITGDTNVTLSHLVTGINQELLNVRESNAAAAGQLSATGLSGEAAEKILHDHYRAYPWAISSATVSNESILVGIAPDTYNNTIGTNLSFQEQTVRIIQAQGAHVSTVFPIVEGSPAIVQSYPVFTSNGTYLGYVDLTYRPDMFIGRIAESVLNSTLYEAMVIQTDGVILYSPNPADVGRNGFLDSASVDPALQALFAKVSAEPSGTGSSNSWDPIHENRSAVWAPAGTDGATWRVIVYQKEISS